MAIFNSFDESYCSLEVSKMFKILGFKTGVYRFWSKGHNTDTPCIKKGIEAFAYTDVKADWNTFVPYPNDEKDVICSAPSHDVAIKWLLKNFGICVSASVSSSGKFMYEVWKVNETPERGWDRIKSEYGFDTIEKATDMGLIYSLKHLI